MHRRHLLAASALLAASPPLSLLAAEPADDNIDELLEEIRSKNFLPALAGAAIVKGKVISGAVGVRKAGDKTPVTVNDQFHLGSCTKSMTATLCGMFSEEGKLKWESTLAELLPDLADKMHADFRPVTLDQLLAHRTGMSGDTNLHAGTLRRLYDDGTLGTTIREQRTKYLELAMAEPPVNRPGSQFVYSNRNFIAAGAILERLADVPWEDLIRKRLFDPLEMTTAGFGAMGTPGKVDQPWQHIFILGWRQPIEPGPKADNPPPLGPAGTVHSSIGDWAKYLLQHLRGESGQSKLLKAETFQRLHTTRPGEDYAGGWVIAERDWGGGKVLTHSGSNTMSYCVAWLAPLRDFACLAMTNQGNGPADAATDKVCEKLINRFLPGG